MYGMKKTTIRLRLSIEDAEWVRAYAAANGTSINRTITNAIDDQRRRTQHRRLRTPM
jgi:predicted DNA binding CopG/RHH family protein